jgi:hypothetical protein
MNLVTVNFEMPCMVCRTEFRIRMAWRHKNREFLGAFPELRKATVSFVLSVGMERLGSHWTDYYEI